MAKKETFGSYTRFARADVKTFAINDIENRILPTHEPDKSVVHPRDLRRRLQDIVASDRYCDGLEKRFLSRFQSSKVAAKKAGRVNTMSKIFESFYGKKAAKPKAKKK